MMPRQTYILTYLHASKLACILKCICGSNSLYPRVIQKFYFWPFFSLAANRKRCGQEGSHLCHSQSEVVYACHVLIWFIQRFGWPKFHILFSFGLNMKIKMGVVIHIYVNQSPDYIDSKYICAHGSHSLGSSIFTEIPFWYF